MAMIKLSPFSGVTPRTGKRLLPDTGAQSASNIKLQSGELRPLNQPGLVTSPAGPKVNPPLAIFYARDTSTGTELKEWFSWPIEVDCVRVPLAADVESRFCWTGDGPPKMATYTNAVSGGSNNYPLLANELTLGIPTPQTACGVSASGGVGSAVTRFYCYTFLSQYGEESAPSPISAQVVGKTDDTWSITAMDTAPANSGAGTATATRFTNTASAKHWLRVGDQVYFGGAPTTARTVTAIFSASAFDVTGASIAAETTWTRKTPWNTASMTKNLYRTSGSTGAFQLVNNATIAVATTTYSDTYTDAVIAGDDLISTGWEPPPVGLTCLGVHPSGALYGMVGNLLCLSEPLQPHAWPTAYQLSSGYNGVGLASFGSTIVMATSGPPFVAAGVEPASMTGEDVKGMYPCLSKRSVISVGDGVLYASKHGLVSVGTRGVSMFTDPWYTRDEWDSVNPETMICETANGRVYVAYQNDSGVQQMLIFDGPLLMPVSVQAEELYADVSSGDLYIGTTTGIYLFDDPAKTPLPGQWRSKEFVFPAPVNLGAAKLEFDLAVDPAIRIAILAEIAAAEAANAVLILAGDIHGSINTFSINGSRLAGSDLVAVPDNPADNAITFNLYQDDTLKMSRPVYSSKAFRLPAGFKVDNYSVEIITQCRVKEVRVAETMDGLRGA